ncbi:MAG TPA: Nramp family divalent metal transporter [Bacillales bacterium]|nr:Nramp family divalent metal transporter [Bacillales bacterium]
METKPEQSNLPTGTSASFWKKLSLVGPGIVVAATGVGAGDMVAAIVAGSSFGMALLWAVIVGALLKFFLSEGLGRWHLATGKTILEGWHSLGWAATGYFSVYVILFGFIYGAAVSSTCALVATALVPSVPLWAWAIIHPIVGFILIMLGRYQLLERIMMVLIAIMFITVVGSAVILMPSLGDLAWGIVPKIPGGSFLRILGLIGGVGGSITLASYGYWLQAKGWKGKSWIPVMKVDASVAYIITGIFGVAIMIIATHFLFGTGLKISGDQGMLQLADPYGEAFGGVARWLLLLGFWGAAFTSLLGSWNGISYLFADFVRVMKKKKKDTRKDEEITEKSPAFIGYMAWMTFPPMLLLLVHNPVGIVIIYGALGAIFMPFLAITLFYLLNSKRVGADYRNGVVYNVILGLIVLIFVVLGAKELYHMFV